MADKKDWYSLQLVTEEAMDTAFEYVEAGSRRDIDLSALGSHPTSGLDLLTDGSLTVSVTAGVGLAVGADSLRRRVRLAATADLDLTDSIPVANPRWVLIALHFTRELANPTYDGDNAEVFEDHLESAEVVIIEGSEAASPSKPAIPSDHVPLADFKLTVGQAGVDPWNVDYSRAKPAWARSRGGVATQLAAVAAHSFDRCRVTVTDPPSASVVVRAGRVNFGHKSFSVAQTNVGPIAAAAAGNKRIDLVYIDSAGAVQRALGTEVLEANPATAPSHLGRCPLAEVAVTDAVVITLVEDDITDVRPVVGASRDSWQYYEFTAIGGETDITPGWEFIPGSHSLFVFVNNSLLPESAYTEASDGLSITLDDALLLDDALVLRAVVPGEVNPVSAHQLNHSDPDGPDALSYAAIAGTVMPGFEMYTTGDNAITVEPFTAVVDGKLRSSSADVTLGASITGLAAATWYYLYAAWVGGVMTVEVSTTPPDTKRRTKTDDASRTYLGAIRTTSTSKIRAFRRSNRTTRWLYAATFGGVPADGTALYGLAGSLNNGNSFISCVGGFPPHVGWGEFYARVTGTSDDEVELRGAGSQVSLWRMKWAADGNFAAGHHSLDGSTRVFCVADANVTIDVYPHAFED